MLRRREVLGLLGLTIGAGMLGAAPAQAVEGAVPGGLGASPHRSLRVLQFNTWLGGTEVPGGRDGIVDTIANVQPDVVTLSESGPDLVAGILTDLASRGQTYHDNDSPGDPSVISRYPIIESAHFPFWSKAVISVGGVEVAVYSGHLEYRYYANYLPRGYGGGTPEPLETSEYGWDEILTGPITDVALIERINAASGRTEVTRTVLVDAAGERRKGRLTVLGGDFNEPSHRDWTRRTRNLFDHNGVVTEWSTTKSIEDAGFRDSYREIFPDPVWSPGFTWPSDNLGTDPSKLTWTPKADERDRIDFIFYFPDRRIHLRDSVIVGPSSSIVRSQRVEESGRDVFLEPSWVWPSDHKGVLSTFRITSRG